MNAIRNTITTMTLGIGILTVGNVQSSGYVSKSNAKHISKVRELKHVARKSFEQKNEAVMLVTIEGDVHVYNFIPGLVILIGLIGIYPARVLIIRSEKEDHPI